MVLSKKSTIRNESELPREFAHLVAQDSRIASFKLNSKESPSEAVLDLDGQQHRFALKFLLAPAVSDIQSPPPSVSTRSLLVVPRLTPAFLNACQQKQASAADLNGQFFLRAPGLFISLPRLPDRDYRFEQEPRNIFVGKSARIVRCLLSDPERLWQQPEVIRRTGATPGLVSRIVTHLTRQGLVRKTDTRHFSLTAPLDLLDAWAQADDFSRRTVTYRFAVLNNDPLRLAKTLRDALTHGGHPFAFTQWIAAWLRHPYTEPPVVSLYVSRLPPESLLDELGLQPVNEAGRVWFHIPSDEGVFRERRFVQDLPLVTDAQIYLDLLKTGLRGPEQAQALRKWSGFSRP